MLPVNHPPSTVATSPAHKAPVLNIRPTEDFKALPLPRPGGSSFDVQIFEEISTRHRWIGKCDMQAASRPQARAPYKARYYDEYREWLGFALYQLCGVTTPEIVLSPQKVQPASSLTAEQKAAMARDYDYETPCLHTFSRFLEGFETCGEKYHLYQIPRLGALIPEKIKEHAVVLVGAQAYFVENQSLILRDEKPLFVPISLSASERNVLSSAFGEIKYTDANPNASLYDRVVSEATTRGRRIRASFLDEYHAHVAQRRDEVFRLTPAGSNHAIPLRGFGAALAVADFIYDGDCVGRGGKNIGYVLSVDKTHAQIVKIDTGFAFSFLEGEVFDHQPKVRTIPLAPGQIGNRVFSLHYDELTVPDQKEFVQMAKRILALPWPSIEAVVEQVVKPDGLSRVQAKILLEKLLDRKNTFLNAFYPEVAGHLGAEEMALRKQVQCEREQVLLSWMRESESKRESKIEASAVAATDSFSLGQLVSEQQTVDHLKGMLEALRVLDEKDEKRARKSPEPCRLFQCPAVVADFTGREDAVQQLAEALHRKQGGVVSQGIRGLGGVGKTQLAAYYVSLAKQGVCCGTQQLRYDAIIWLAAERELESQIRNLAEAWYGVKGLSPVDTLNQLQRQLNSKRVLWIFDNAETEKSLLPLLKIFRGGHYHVLITSRNSAWGDIPLLSLEGFNPPEGVAYVKKHLAAALSTEIDALLNTVSYLPLALAHAVAYIKAGHCHIKDYPQEFAKHQLSVVGTVTVSASGQTVMTTFLLTLKKLLSHYPATAAILEACAYFAPENIPIALLEAGLVQRFILFSKKGYYSNSVFRSSLSALIRHNLLESTASDTVSIHRLVQGAVRGYHQHRVSNSGVAAHLNHWVACFNRFLKFDDKNWSTVLRVNPVIPHALTLVEACEEPLAIALETLSPLLDRIGRHQQAIGAYRAAGQVFRRALVFAKRYYGENHPAVAILLGNLASVLLHLGQAAEAKPLYEQALSVQKKYYGENCPEIAMTLNNLASALTYLGRATEAKPLYEQALAIQKKHYGEKHLQVATALESLGFALRELGQAAEAKFLYEQACVIYEKHYGENHLEIAIILVNLAKASYDLGQAAKAKPLFEKACVIFRKHYGDEHYSFAMTLMGLGGTLCDLGCAIEAKPLLEQALAIQKKYYGNNKHPEVAKTLTTLGEALRILGRASEAKEYLEEALVIKQKHYKNVHPEVAITLGYLGVTLRDLGEVSIAQAYLWQARYIFLTQFGAEHRRTQWIERELTLFMLPSVESKSADSAETKFDTAQRAIPALFIGPVAQANNKPELLVSRTAQTTRCATLAASSGSPVFTSGSSSRSAASSSPAMPTVSTAAEAALRTI